MMVIEGLTCSVHSTCTPLLPTVGTFWALILSKTVVLMPFLTIKYVHSTFVCTLWSSCCQMCYDCASGLLYVVGGHITFTNVCSGLYAYHTVNKQWICLEPDQSHDPNVKAVLPRSGHVACFHPVSNYSCAEECTAPFRPELNAHRY